MSVTGMSSNGDQAAQSGEGLPRFQAFLLRYGLFPSYRCVTSREKAAAIFQAEGRKLTALARRLPPDHFPRKVHIGSLWGLETASCNWSAEMVLEHLIEAGTQTAICIIELSHGEKVTAKGDDLTPRGGQGPRLLEDYTAFLEDYAQTLQEDIGSGTNGSSHPHPEFGQLTAHGWACLGAFHQSVHRRQMERIVTELHSQRIHR
jgi:hypothetical protein